MKSLCIFAQWSTKSELWHRGLQLRLVNVIILVFKYQWREGFSRKVIGSKFHKSIKLGRNVQWISWHYKSNRTLNSLAMVNQHPLVFWYIPSAAGCACGKLGAICLSKEFSVGASVWRVTTISEYWAGWQWRQQLCSAPRLLQHHSCQLHNLFRARWAETLVRKCAMVSVKVTRVSFLHFSCYLRLFIVRVRSPPAPKEFDILRIHDLLELN